MSKLDEMEKKLQGLQETVDQLSKDFAALRLDLKSANILHDEEYVPPPADELSAREKPPKKKKSKVEQMVEKSDPFA